MIETIPMSVARVTEYEMGSGGMPIIAYSFKVGKNGGLPELYANTDPFEDPDTHSFLLPRSLDNEPIERRRYVHTHDPKGLYAQVWAIAFSVSTDSLYRIVDEETMDAVLEALENHKPIPPPKADETIIQLPLHYAEREITITPIEHGSLAAISWAYDHFHDQFVPGVDEVAEGLKNSLLAMHQTAYGILRNIIERELREP